MSTYVHCGTVYNSKNLEPTQMPINERTDKENVAHIHCGILCSHKKWWVHGLCRDMDESGNHHSQQTDKRREIANVDDGLMGAANHHELHMEPKESPHSQVNSKKKEHSREHHTTGFQTILQGYSNQNSMVLVPKQRYRPMEQNRGIGGNTTYLKPYNLW